MNIKLSAKRSTYIGLLAIVVALMLGSATGISLLAGFFLGAGTKGPTFTQATEADLFNGFASVADYGAVPNDGKDDTKAFLKAASTGMNVFVPAGEYQVKKTITLYGGQIAGSSLNNTLIISTGSDPILDLNNGAGASQLSLSFKEISGKEKVGNKIAVRIGTCAENQIGSYLHDLQISHVGTAFYSDVEGNAHNETFENIRIDDFSAAGIYLKTTQRDNLCLRSVSLSDAKASCGVMIENGSAAALEQVMLENVTAEDAIILSDCMGFTVRTASFIDTSATNLLALDNSVGTIGSLFDKRSSGTVLGIKNVDFEMQIPVDFIHAEDVTEKQQFKLVGGKALNSKCTVTVDSCTAKGLAEAHQTFPCDTDANLSIEFLTKK